MQYNTQPYKLHKTAYKPEDELGELQSGLTSLEYYPSSLLAVNKQYFPFLLLQNGIAGNKIPYFFWLLGSKYNKFEINIL